MNPRSYILSKFPDHTPNASGKMHMRCPFHDDKHPSFSIDVNRGLFVCGSAKCGVRGNFLMFYKLMEGIETWREVYKRLKSSRIEIDIDKLLGIEKEIAQQERFNPWPQENMLTNVGQCDYLQNRGLGEDIVTQFNICRGTFGQWQRVNLYNTLVVPVFELDGTYKTFQARFLDPNRKPRWQAPVNSPLQDLLYGGWLVNGRTTDLWIVEGASDVWKMHTFGAQAVGLFTKEATSSQFNKLFYLCTLYDLRPIVCLDGDVVKAQKKNPIKKLFCELQAYGLSPSVVYLSEDEDPGSLTLERFQELSTTLGGNDCIA